MPYVSAIRIWEITSRHIWAFWDLVSPYMGSLFQADTAYTVCACCIYVSNIKKLTRERNVKYKALICLNYVVTCIFPFPTLCRYI